MEFSPAIAVSCRNDANELLSELCSRAHADLLLRDDPSSEIQRQSTGGRHCFAFESARLALSSVGRIGIVVRNSLEYEGGHVGFVLPFVARTVLGIGDVVPEIASNPSPDCLQAFHFARALVSAVNRVHKITRAIPYDESWAISPRRICRGAVDAGLVLPAYAVGSGERALRHFEVRHATFSVVDIPLRRDAATRTCMRCN